MTGTAALLAGTAARRPDGVALIDAGRGRATTFGELDLDARRVAGALRAAGLGPGDRVALSAENGTDLVACFFGIVYAGGTVVPLPILSVAPEAALRIEHARCRVLITDAPRAELARETVALLDEPPVRLDASRRGEPLAAPLPIAADADALVLYTSGTTGGPKGVCITHRSLVAHTDALVRDTLALGEGDAVLGALPLTHSYGLRMAMLASIRAGARSILVPRFDATSTLEIADRERVTFLPAVPTMLSAWAGASGPTPRAVRLCLSAGAPLPEDVRTAGEARLGTEVRQGYGLTEATFSTVNARPDRRVPGSSGRPVPGVEVRLGEADEVLVRGPNVMRGYLDDPVATAAAFEGGWLRTGDVGRLDGEGRLTVVDRLRDLVLRGGHSIYPAEVEEVLAGHPAVAAVAVIGRPDPRHGEEVVAVVVRRPGAELAPADLAAFAARRLSRTKVPREVAFVDALPLGPSGKVQKRELRRRLADGELPTEPVRR